METKVCVKCNKEKEVNLFTKLKRNSDGYSHVCKECLYGHVANRFTRNSEQLTEKECNKCKKILPIDRFNKIKKGDKIYFLSSCKKCKNKIYNEPGKVKRGVNRKKRLKRNYGITEGNYQEMLKEQNNSCKICGTALEKGKVLSIDHCHTTGKIRGLLCHHCNTGLGLFKDNIETLQLAIEYLKESRV